MKIVIPITLILVVILLYLNFRNVTETLIVLASVPFASWAASADVLRVQLLHRHLVGSLHW